jgi:phytoene dehydrogenase-like protein
MAGVTHDVVVVGGGHNGLVCAAYLARAGLDTVVLEARDLTGGCASTVDAVGARVNICNCDHLAFRTTPIADELDLGAHGLRYLDVDPAQLSVNWNGAAPWYHFHDVEQTIESLRRTHPDEVDGYRRYLRAAVPVAELALEIATEVPTVPNVLRRVLDRRAAGVRTMLSWSRKSVAEVLCGFFRSEALLAPVVVTGPAVWGLAPETPGTGLGATGYALKHVAQVGRPVGGSGAVPAALTACVVAAGGTIRTGARVDAILCEGNAVRGVQLAGGEVFDAPRVVVACDPTDALVTWLRDAPPQAAHLSARWASRPHRDGYESKIDAVVSQLPVLRGHDRAHGAALGVRDAWGPTTIVAPTLDGIAEAHAAMGRGAVAERPMLFVNIPSVLDGKMRAPSAGGGTAGAAAHVLSVEVLFTPYELSGGWDGSPEPDRWLDALAGLLEPGFRETILDWRVMTPISYEREFNLRRGHAPSFAGGALAALVGKERELTRYETPVPGLYLTGAATFPGAGVWGASGRNAASIVLRGRAPRRTVRAGSIRSTYSRKAASAAASGPGASIGTTWVEPGIST